MVQPKWHTDHDHREFGVIAPFTKREDTDSACIGFYAEYRPPL
ncbi:MAG: hypothetical protein P8L78_12725 [Mariniblastus sp.]|nr:hypothetical protein [Mariniblastus sp.]